MLNLRKISLRRKRLRTTLSLVSFAALTMLSGADVLRADVDEALPDGALELALWKAEVRVVLKPGAAGRIQATIASGQGKVDPDAPTVTLRSADGKFRVARDQEAGELRLAIDVVRDPAQPISIVGSDLQIYVQGPDLPDPEEIRRIQQEAIIAGETPDLPEPVTTDLNFTLGESSVELTTVRGAKIKARNTWLDARHVAGEIDLDLEGGSARIAEHHDGKLIFNGRRAEMEINDSVVDVRFTAVGGQTRVDGLRGKIEAEFTDATFVLLGWLGTASVEGTRTAFDIHSLPAGGKSLQLGARDSTTTIDNFIGGILQVVLEGGEMTGTNLEANSEIQVSQGGSVSISEAKNRLQLNLIDARGEVRNADRLEATLQGSRLDAEEIRTLTVGATNSSEIVANNILQFPQVRLDDSEGEFRLKMRSKKPEVHLVGGARARVELPMPCFVSVQEGDAGAVQLSGCQLRLAGQKPIDRRGNIADPSVLTVELGPDAEVEVDGYTL